MKHRNQQWSDKIENILSGRHVMTNNNESFLGTTYLVHNYFSSNGPSVVMTLN